MPRTDSDADRGIPVYDGVFQLFKPGVVKLKIGDFSRGTSRDGKLGLWNAEQIFIGSFLISSHSWRR